MTAPALAAVVPHPAMAGPVADMGQVAEAYLVLEARRLARKFGLADAASLLTRAAAVAQDFGREETRP